MPRNDRQKSELVNRVNLYNGKITIDPKVVREEKIIIEVGWKVFLSCDIPAMFNYGHIHISLFGEFSR